MSGEGDGDVLGRDRVDGLLTGLVLTERARHEAGHGQRADRQDREPLHDRLTHHLAAARKDFACLSSGRSESADLASATSLV